MKFANTLKYWVASFALCAWTGNVLAQSNVKTVSSQEIFPPQAEHAHGSSIVALPNGDLLAAWFQGSGERTADDVRILGSRKAKSSANWSAPFLMADTPGIPDCNPVLFLNSKNELTLAWIAVLGNQWEHSILRTRKTKNYNQAGAPIWDWQDNILLKPGEEFVKEVQEKFKQLPELNHGWSAYAPDYDKLTIEATKNSKYRSIGWMTRIKPLVLGEKIILPLYSDGFNLSLMAISEDNGETWKPSLPLVGRGPIQPALAQRKNGDIVAMLRDSGDGPTFIQQSISKDQGQSWSPATKTNLPNTASVEMLKLADGRWILIGNDIHDGRYQLALWISTDEGATWSSKPLYLENDTTKKGGFSYPSLIQDSNGLIHITYSSHFQSGKTIIYKSINPELLK
ncbi:exo-alpha-sialidase [Algoriphagus sp. A40]|uniref:sialidase family protein n=1 Tax=Algoriphagus sp. A40 TaxID=1945863 RepID=UPI000986C430|nr:exo-alpha-sialidase [Algoriphagus sp. A40]OOG77131.1 neuraminidase [Algoriphagus sp. A40]